MKKSIFAIAFLVVGISNGCFNRNDENQRISIKDSETEYTFEALYPESKTERIRTFINRELNNELPLAQHIDVLVSLANGEKFNLKASKGVVKIQFDKKNSSLASYMKIKRLGARIRERLSEK